MPPHSHSVVLINSNELIYEKNIFFTPKTSVAQTVKYVWLLISKGDFAVRKISRFRHLSVSAGQPFGMPLSAENDVGGVIGRLMFGDAVAERW